MSIKLESGDLVELENLGLKAIVKKNRPEWKGYQAQSGLTEFLISYESVILGHVKILARKKYKLDENTGNMISLPCRIIGSTLAFEAS